MVIGGNFLTFNFMQGTPSAMRDDPTSPLIYILEDNGAESVYNVQNQLQLLILQPNFRNVRGILIGTFRRESNTTRDLLTKMIKTKEELRNVPVIANVDFGQTVPTVTLPIVGYMRIEAKDNSDEIFILMK
jgi:muramoyltetrapeptide carboxypeptidase LdcA involved in peptidoglycan recycling